MNSLHLSEKELNPIQLTLIIIDLNSDFIELQIKWFRYPSVMSALSNISS